VGMIRAAIPLAGASGYCHVRHRLRICLQPIYLHALTGYSVIPRAFHFPVTPSKLLQCCVLRLPQWPPSSFRWRCYHWLRWLSELRLASGRCTPARPVANLPARIGFVSFGSTGCKPPTCVDCSALPLVLRRSIWLAPDDPGLIGLAPDNPGSTRLAPHGSFLRLGRQPTSDSHRCRPLARLAASSGLRLMLPLPLGWLRFQFAPAASPSALTVREPLGLRLVAPSPAEPVMHSLFQLNLASPAKPSMSSSVSVDRLSTFGETSRHLATHFTPS
jgi:hypothetical protein